MEKPANNSELLLVPFSASPKAQRKRQLQKDETDHISPESAVSQVHETVPEENENDGFLKVVRKRIRHKNQMIVGSGSGDNIGLRSKGRFVSLFISRLNPDCDSSEIETYIKSKFDSELKCEKLDTRYDTYASFRAEGYCKNPSIFYDADMWPESVLVRKFFKSRK